MCYLLMVLTFCLSQMDNRSPAPTSASRKPGSSPIVCTYAATHPSIPRCTKPVTTSARPARAARLRGYSLARMRTDTDAWGYSFRLGSAQAWFEQDAEDALAWLIQHDVLDSQHQITWRRVP